MSGSAPHPDLIPSAGDEARHAVATAARKRTALKWCLLAILLVLVLALAGPDRTVTQEDKDVLDAVLSSSAPSGLWYPSEPLTVLEIKDRYDSAIPNSIKTLFYLRNRLPIASGSFRGAKKLVFLDLAAVNAAFDKGFGTSSMLGFPPSPALCRSHCPFTRTGEGGP